MTERAISSAAERFLQDRIASLLHLEVLLLLGRDGSRWVDAGTIAAALRVSVASTERVLENLGAANLVDVKLGSSLAFRFAPMDEQVLPLIDEVAGIYFADRPMLELLLARQRRASGAARTFAEAFRLSRRKPDG
ncbi:hypothetical protein BH18ACI5_BH18ACI5_18780 [soil metagenome]